MAPSHSKPKVPTLNKRTKLTEAEFLNLYLEKIQETNLVGNGEQRKSLLDILTIPKDIQRSDLRLRDGIPAFQRDEHQIAKLGSTFDTDAFMPYNVRQIIAERIIKGKKQYFAVLRPSWIAYTGLLKGRKSNDAFIRFFNLLRDPKTFGAKSVTQLLGWMKEETKKGETVDDNPDADFGIDLIIDIGKNIFAELWFLIAYAPVWLSAKGVETYYKDLLEAYEKKKEEEKRQKEETMLADLIRKEPQSLPSGKANGINDDNDSGRDSKKKKIEKKPHEEPAKTSVEVPQADQAKEMNQNATKMAENFKTKLEEQQQPNKTAKNLPAEISQILPSGVAIGITQNALNLANQSTKHRNHEKNRLEVQLNSQKHLAKSTSNAEKWKDQKRHLIAPRSKESPTKVSSGKAKDTKVEHHKHKHTDGKAKESKVEHHKCKHKRTDGKAKDPKVEHHKHKHTDGQDIKRVSTKLASAQSKKQKYFSFSKRNAKLASSAKSANKITTLTLAQTREILQGTSNSKSSLNKSYRIPKLPQKQRLESKPINQSPLFKLESALNGAKAQSSLKLSKKECKDLNEINKVASSSQNKAVSEKSVQQTLKSHPQNNEPQSRQATATTTTDQSDLVSFEKATLAKSQMQSKQSNTQLNTETSNVSLAEPQQPDNSQSNLSAQIDAPQTNEASTSQFEQPTASKSDWKDLPEYDPVMEAQIKSKNRKILNYDDIKDELKKWHEDKKGSSITEWFYEKQQKEKELIETSPPTLSAVKQKVTESAQVEATTSSGSTNSSASLATPIDSASEPSSALNENGKRSHSPADESSKRAKPLLPGPLDLQ